MDKFGIVLFVLSVLLKDSTRLLKICSLTGSMVSTV